MPKFLLRTPPAVSPVTFRPGRARLSAKPTPTASAVAVTIGMVLVTALAARASGVAEATITANSMATTGAGRYSRTALDDDVLAFDVHLTPRLFELNPRSRGPLLSWASTRE
jgi:hypothetical protein